MSPWIVIGIIGVGTYLTRVSFIAAFGQQGVPPWMEPPLRYIAPAVIAAIVAPLLIAPEGSVDLTLGNLRLLAGIFAIVVAIKTKSLSMTIIAGMAMLWLLQAVF